MFWNRNKKDKATIANEKKRFNHLLSVAEKLPVKALPDLGFEAQPYEIVR
ncbi:hypothetical protein K3M84_004250 [Escherichia coli]|nr:hypothetical protein [Escherichia coli]